jgi:hypothetical protein
MPRCSSPQTIELGDHQPAFWRLQAAMAAASCGRLSSRFARLNLCELGNQPAAMARSDS